MVDAIVENTSADRKTDFSSEGMKTTVPASTDFISCYATADGKEIVHIDVSCFPSVKSNSVFYAL